MNPRSPVKPPPPVGRVMIRLLYSIGAKLPQYIPVLPGMSLHVSGMLTNTSPVIGSNPYTVQSLACIQILSSK